MANETTRAIVRNSIPRDVLIALLGVLATFVATYLGVYLASGAQKRADDEKSLDAYKTMLSVMAVDCRQTLKLNQDVNPGDKLAQLRSPVFLYSTPLQNSLLFQHMDRSKLTDLIHSITRSAFFGSKYQEYVSLSPSGILPPVYPKEGETPVQTQERFIAEGQAFARRRAEDAKQFHSQYLAETEKLCRLLEQ